MSRYVSTNTQPTDRHTLFPRAGSSLVDTKTTRLLLDGHGGIWYGLKPQLNVLFKMHYLQVIISKDV